MRIDIWSDLVCPWCAIGKANLDQALQQFEHAGDTDVIWRSFELDPGAPAVRTGFDLVRPANTFDAHRLLHLAKAYGVQDDLARRLTRAYLAEGEVLSDHPTLQRLAEGVGLAAAQIAETLAGSAFTEHVRADEADAARREITAVPTFLIDDRLVIPGAQTPESMLATLRRAWTKQHLNA